MEHKNSMSRVERLHREKVTRYSIRKYSFGAASVAVAALFMFLGNGAVSANELSKQDTPSVEAPAKATEDKTISEEATAKPAEATTPTLDKSELTNLISEIETKLSNGSYDNKTEESVAVLKADLESAKATLANATTQAELKQAYSKLVTTANSKLKNKPVEKKETPAVDTTEGKETVGKKADNTEKNPESNSIENTGSKDPRNGQALDKNNAFRAETTETQGTFTYSMEYSNGKEIYLYNEENADIDITVNSTAGNIKRATVKAGSGQFVLKSKSDQAIAYTKYKRGTMPPEEEVEIDGYGWSYHQTLSDTPGPVKIKITGKPNDTFKGIKDYTKAENQRAVLGARYLELEDSNGNKLSGGSNLNAPGAFNLVVKSQTYKYDIQPVTEENKVGVADINNLTAPDITKIKEKIKIQYSDKATTQDARLASHKGEVLADRSSVVKEIAVADGTVTVTYKDDSVDTTPVASVARTNAAPTVEIPFSVDGKKDVYVYANEDIDVDLKYNDDSGKIKFATIKQGGNKALSPVDSAEPNIINNEYNTQFTQINAETATPAIVKITGKMTKETPGLTASKFPTDENGEYRIVTRYATATDLDDAIIENTAVGNSYATDPGAFTLVLKAQTRKYDIKAPETKVTVANANNITEDEFNQIKDSIKIQYSTTNPDKNLLDKQGKDVENQTDRIESITREGNNVVVTYKDGSKDTKALADFVNVAPTVEIPYSNQANKQIYVYTGENTDLTFKGTDENEVKDLYLRGPGDISKDNTTDYGFTTGKITDGTVTTGVGEVSADKRTATVKMTGKTNLAAGKEWTSFVVSKDNDGKLSNTDYRALDKDPNAKEKPGYVRFVVKNQTSKYDIATPTEKVEVANPDNVTNDELNKIKEKLQLEYSQTNDDANLADKKGTTVADKNNKIQSVTKDADGNLVVTYTDGSTDKKPLSEFVTDTTAPAKPVVDTDLTGKAGTKTPVEVSAEPGSTVELFDKDGNKIGEGTADENGKATITPTVDLPEGNVTAKATDPAGNTSDASDPAKATSDDQSVKDPAVTPVVDPSNLTDAEKAKVADEVKKANPTASKVEVGNDGTATVTYPDGTTAILTPKQTITKVSETGNKGNSNSNSDNNSDKTSNTFVKVPAEKTLVKDPSNLTDAERSEIVSKIKQVNPGATVKVDRYGNATVELNGKTVVISSGQLIVSAEETNGQASHQGRVATDSSKKSESGKLPSTGEEQSVASIGLAILSALTGGLLLSKKRKEEE